MTTEGLGQYRSQAVGFVFESVVPNILTIYPQHFLIPEISETLKGSFTKFFGTETKNFRRKIDTPYYA